MRVKTIAFSISWKNISLYLIFIKTSPMSWDKTINWIQFNGYCTLPETNWQVALGWLLWTFHIFQSFASTVPHRSAQKWLCWLLQCWLKRWIFPFFSQQPFTESNNKRYKYTHNHTSFELNPSSSKTLSEILDISGVTYIKVVRIGCQFIYLCFIVDVPQPHEKWPHTYFTRPAVCPLETAFWYCFCATSFSFMVPG